jgi:hypothetical protein
MNKNITHNIYENANSTNTMKLMKLYEILDTIKNGDENLNQIEEARKLGKESPQYGEIKRKRTSVAWNASFKNYGRSNDDITGATGIVYMDKDSLSQEEIKAFKELLMGLSYVIAIWISFGGNGIGCLVNCEEVTMANFKSVWEQINSEVGIGFDEGVKKIGQINFLSYDPDIRINYNASSFPHKENWKRTEGNTSISGKINKPLFISNDTRIEQEKINKEYYNNSNSSSNSLNLVCPRNTPFIRIFNSGISYKSRLPQEVFGGNKVVSFSSPIPFYEVNTGYDILEGKRNICLFAIASNFLKINPALDKEKLLAEMFSINNFRCKPPLPPGEIITIVNSCYKRLNEDKLNPAIKYRSIVANPNIYMENEEWRTLISIETGRIRRERTIAAITEAIKLLKDQGIIITQKQVAAAIDNSKETIKKYWKLFKTDVTNYNKLIRMKIR